MTGSVSETSVGSLPSSKDVAKVLHFFRIHNMQDTFLAKITLSYTIYYNFYATIITILRNIQQEIHTPANINFHISSCIPAKIIVPLCREDYAEVSGWVLWLVLATDK